MALDIDLFALLRTLINDINVKLASATYFAQISDDMHYLAACFIRGGLFGGEKDTSEADVKKGKAKSGKQAA
jgi:hypothetical protein